MLGSPSVYIFLGSQISIQMATHWREGTFTQWCCVSDEAKGLICTVIWCPSYWLQ